MYDFKSHFRKELKQVETCKSLHIFSDQDILYHAQTSLEFISKLLWICDMLSKMNIFLQKKTFLFIR